jgi:2-dehydropantoate 2-reductase
MKILVMGAGAIGCFVGGHLAAAGQHITLLGRAPLMQKIAVEGLTLRWPNRPEQVVFPHTAVHLPTPLDFDFILLTVKAPDTIGAIAQLAAVWPPTGQPQLVSLQNGIGNEAQLAVAFGPEHIIAGTITIPIQSPQPGVIAVSKAKGGLGLAGLSPGQPVDPLGQALNQAGLPTQIYPDWQAMKWSKLLLNMINNATSAILNQPPAQIIAQPALFDLELEALREAVGVMRAQGIHAVKLPGYPVNWLARLVSARWLPAPLLRAILRPFMVSGRGTKMPSLQIDLTAGRPTSEINVLNGAVVQAGHTLGLSTPVNRRLTDTLNGLVSGQLNWTDYQNHPEKILQ